VLGNQITELEAQIDFGDGQVYTRDYLDQLSGIREWIGVV
jgi:hypothetical protein